MATITGLATSDANFSILVSALQFVDSEIEGSNLVATLDDPTQSLTVFAPTNASFAAFAADVGYEGAADDTDAITSFLVSTFGAETLRDVLLYHVAAGELSSADVTAATEITTLQGGTIMPDVPVLGDNEPDLIDPSLDLDNIDIAADNGVVHVIDRVLIPVDLPGNSTSSITDIATGDANFSILVSALQFVDSEIEGSDLVATLDDPTQSLTVFAPTNASFAAFAADVGYEGAADDTGAITTFLVDTFGAETLRDVLLYHVAAGELSSADVTAATEITTLQGGTIASDVPVLGDAEPDLIDPSLDLDNIDIEASNGVVHVIDRVLIPVDLPGNDAPSIAGIVAASGETDTNGEDFDLLLAAVSAAGLVETLDGPGDFTVFAPNDAAFIGLAQALGFTGDSEDDALAFIIRGLTLFGAGDPIPLLTEVLTYHVVGESLQASQVLSATDIVTLQGGTLTVNGTVLGDADPDLPDPGIIATDIQASNGIVHVIDGVLLPADLLASDGADDVDVVLGDDTDENISTGADADLIDAAGGDDAIFAGIGADIVLAGAGNDQVVGDAGNDTLDGGDGLDTLNGGDGDDVIRGGTSEADLRDVIYAGDGNDVIDAGAGNDLVFGMGGNDTINGAHGADELRGQGGDDVIAGNALSDVIFGNDGDDFINGGFGSDRLNGGDGADTFFHLGTSGHGSDWIQDFSNGDGDMLQFGGSGATADDFVVHTNHTTDSGDPSVQEAFIDFRGQVLWALVDGAGEDSIMLRLNGETIDLLA